MDYSNTKKKKLIELDNGRCKVQWNGGSKLFISKYHAEQYILKCEEYKATEKLNKSLFDNGIIEFNSNYGFGEDIVVNSGGVLTPFHIEYDYDD